MATRARTAAWTLGATLGDRTVRRPTTRNCVVGAWGGLHCTRVEPPLRLRLGQPKVLGENLPRLFIAEPHQPGAVPRLGSA